MTHPPKNTGSTASTDKGERIAKALARAGVGSRRDVERMIEAGRITLDGKVLDTPAVLVHALTGIAVDGKPVEAGEPARLWRLHKKRGTLTTHKDPEGRKTVFDGLPDHVGRVVSVGRLDMNTEGLLLLTNDGALARWLELPENGHIRRYRVRAHGRVDEGKLAALKDGITIDGVHYEPIEAELERVQGSNAWIKVAITEGKNREVRKVMEHLGLVVNRLIRTHYGPFSLGTLRQGAVQEIAKAKVHSWLASYFGEVEESGGSVAAEEVKLKPEKWAKAKTKKTVKPGHKRRRKPHDTDHTNRRPAKGRAEKTTGGGDRPARSKGEAARPAREGARARPARSNGPRRQDRSTGQARSKPPSRGPRS